MDNIKVNIGELIEVVTKENLKFKAIVVKDLGEGFVSRVLEKDEGVGTAAWSRYNLSHSRFQPKKECVSVNLIATPEILTSYGEYALNESIIKSSPKFYVTNLENNQEIVFCCCENYGGWSVGNKAMREKLLQESFLNSQISGIRLDESYNS